SRRRHTRSKRDWSSDVCSSDLEAAVVTSSWPHGPPLPRAHTTSPVVRTGTPHQRNTTVPITPPALHARSRAQILVSDVSVSLGAARVLTGVDLTVTPTSRIAIVGENGRGKSTLLHILSGALPPDEGQVSRIGTLGIAEQEMSTTDRRTVGQVVADAIADSLTALDELVAAGLALAEGEDGAGARFALALEQAEALDAWDARRRVDIALEALDA